MEHELIKSDACEKEDNKESRAVQALVNVFTQERCESDRLKVLRGFRLIFSKCVPTLENKLLHALHIEALFDLIASVDKETTFENEFEFGYVIFLLRLIKYDRKFHDKVRVEMIKYIRILLKKFENLPDFVVRSIWCTLEECSIVWPDLVQEIMPSSKLFIEGKVFQLLNPNCETSNIKYYAKLSSECKDLFQKILAILNKILCLTQGNESILNLISHFVNLVSEFCDENEETIVRLYPRDYSELISLLVIPPEIYKRTRSNISSTSPLEKQVLQLLLANFKNDQNMTLQILTHYPNWLKEFAVCLSSINKDEQ